MLVLVTDRFKKYYAAWLSEDRCVFFSQEFNTPFLRYFKTLDSLTHGAEPFLRSRQYHKENKFELKNT
jgi:hypothetical protein